MVPPDGPEHAPIGLGAYWQNRTIVSGPGNITGSNETGTPDGSRLAVQVLAAPAATSANTGGLPSNPSLYSTVGTPSALQSIVTLNITSTETLDLLLAALMDNTTGGPNAVNGTFQSVTAQVGFLGLSSAVVNAIPNAVEANDGLYGPPGSQFPSSPSPAGWGAFWNAVTSVVTNPAGTVESLAGVVWTAGTAAFTYLDHLATEALALDAQMVARTASAIGHVGQLIESALGTFLAWLWKEISTLFTDATQGLTSAFKSGLEGWMSLLYAAGNHTVAAYEGTTVSRNMAAAAASLGLALAVPVLLATAGGIAVDVLLGVTAPFDIGPEAVASFLVPIVVSLLASTLLGTGGGGWPSKMFGFMEGGVESSITGVSSAAEWLFNQSHTTTSSAASDMIDPNYSPPGDAWALSAAIIGGAGAGSGLGVFKLLDSALPAVITPSAPAPQQAAAAADAGASVVYSLVGLTLVLAEYLVSLAAPQTGPLAAVAYVAEMLLGILGTTFAGMAALTALWGERDPAVRAITGAIGWVGVGMSVGALATGIYDVYDLATHPPS